VRVVEDGLSAGGHGFVGEVQRCRVLVNRDGPSRLVARVDPEQLTVGDRHRQHDVGEQRVDRHHVVEWVPLLFGDPCKFLVQFEDRIERKDQSVMGPHESKTAQLLPAMVAKVCRCTVAKW
jgi:hypothetical protein